MSAGFTGREASPVRGARPRSAAVSVQSFKYGGFCCVAVKITDNDIRSTAQLHIQKHSGQQNRSPAAAPHSGLSRNLRGEYATAHTRGEWWAPYARPCSRAGSPWLSDERQPWTGPGRSL